jgi:Caspase domain
MNWAIVIGVDEYWSEGAHLHGAVNDALAMREWLLDPVGGAVPKEQLLLLVSPRPGVEPSPELAEATKSMNVKATKDNINIAINDLMLSSKGEGERLFFFFAGHGLTARVSNRDEDALVTTGFNAVNTDHSIALRSLWEFFETTQFRDQFFFVDACRNVPEWETNEFEIGRWTLPRSRDPGKPPVQQFVLYATSPGLRAAEVRDEPGAEHGAFTRPLLDGLAGDGAAKAWSWQRSCYEVRWERLVDYVKTRVERETHDVGGGGSRQFQVPQDAGSRGVPGRDRDAVLATLSGEGVENVRLELKLEPDEVYPKASVEVIDGVGATVAEAVRLTGGVVTFELPPRTYAFRAVAPDFKEGRLPTPLELYGPVPQQSISLHPLEEESGAGDGSAPTVVVQPPDPRIVVAAADPLTVIEVRDDAGNVTAVWRTAPRLPQLKPGFYRVRLVGPDASSEEKLVTLTPGEEERVDVRAAPAPPFVAELRDAIGGSTGEGETLVLGDGFPPLAWPQPSTLVTLAVGAAINPASAPAPLRKLALELPAGLADSESGVAVYAVAGGSGEGADMVKAVRVRLWRAGVSIPTEKKAIELQELRPGLGGHIFTAEHGSYWLSLEHGEKAPPPVVALTVLRGRLATVVAQVEPEGLRLYQYHPTLAAGPTSEPTALRRLEYLERSLLGGRLDAAKELTGEIAKTAAEDPFAGCLCGYVLLRLGMYDELRDVIETVIAAAPDLSDVYVLRGEHAAATGGTVGRQSFADATAAGIPVFAEGLTRLVEGLRAHGLQHPRAAIVRYLFQRHLRGSMWSVFTAGRFEEGTLIVTGADTGFEA